MIAADWTPHRREDGELVGWVRPEGEDWVAVDLLGREVSGPTDWLAAEAVLEVGGIGYLADPWMLDGEGDLPVRVRMVEVTPERIVVKSDDFGAIDAPVRQWELPWPLPARLRSVRPDDPDAFTVPGH